MACKRDVVINLVDYIESNGIKVNIGKTKARGNKGLFSLKRDGFRIDISKNIDDSSILPTLLHEFAHFIHYKYDSTLKSLDFVFNTLSDDEFDELLAITVENVPKDFAASLYSAKQQLAEENKGFVKNIKQTFPEFKISQPLKKIEKGISYPVKYLLKYDKVQFFKLIYSIDNLDKMCPTLTQAQISYLKLKSNQRKIVKINSKINRLNKYYNQPTELWARFFELYFTDYNKIQKIAPLVTSKFTAIIEQNTIPEFAQVKKKLQNS